MIECKTGLKTPDGKNLLNDTLYKLKAISSNFGLSVNSFLFTLDSEIRREDNKRASLLNLKIVTTDMLDKDIKNIIT